MRRPSLARLLGSAAVTAMLATGLGGCQTMGDITGALTSKSDTAETTQISRLTTQLALGYPEVGFTLTSDGRVGEVEVRSSSGDHELDRAAVDVARRSRFRLPVPLADAAPGHGYLEYQFQLARRGNT